MRARRSAFAAILLVAFTTPSQAQRPQVTVISGTVLGADGAPLRLAHVHLAGPRQPRRAAAQVPVARDGRFAIATTDTGALYLTFSGVDHYPASLPLMVARPAGVVLDVRLRPYQYTDSLDRVTVIGDFNHFEFGTGRSLERQRDGTYALELEVSADTFAYQFLRLTREARSINGQQALRYVYDGGGDYRSIVRPERGRVRIVLDPAALPRRTGEMRITFRDSSGTVARLAAVHRQWSQEVRSYIETVEARRARQDTSRHDWTPTVRRLAASLARERDPLGRQLFLIQLLNAAHLGARLDSATALRIIRELPPSSPWWSFIEFQGPYLMSRAYFLAAGRPVARQLDSATSRQVVAYLDRVAVQHGDREVQADALMNLVFLTRTAEPRRSNDYYLRLATDYPDYSSLSYVKSQVAPTRVLQVGAAMPEFRFMDLDDTLVTYTRETFAGRPTLIEFWATWCGPCIAEMPALHAAYDSLRPLGVEFFSVSMDERAEDARRFRAGEWRLPWRNGFAPGGFTNQQLRALEILSVPRAVLIGGDGRILAVDGTLRGDRIVPTVRHALQPASP